MTVLVAFDGTALSAAAMRRAKAFVRGTDAGIVAVTVIPTSEKYAQEKGWIDDGKPFSTEAVVDHLTDQVEAIAPEAAFRYELVDQFAPAGTIANRIRRVAADVDAAVVFVGSEDAGGLVAPISSVGGTVSAAREYDVYVARRTVTDRTSEP
jgi:nucleotide-binding universal stress UspA family protein